MFAFEGWGHSGAESKGDELALWRFLCFSTVIAKLEAKGSGSGVVGCSNLRVHLYLPD